MRVLDLFAGIGGFSLGLEQAGMTIAGQCEIDPFCRAVLARHFPSAWRHDDVRTLSGDLIQAACGPIDGIVGGFPCQDVSDAGFRAGIAGRRSGLWAHFIRIIRELDELSFILIENVDGLRRRGLGEVLRDLAACGFDAEWRVLGASDFGAPHVRERIFILAYPPGERFAGDAVAAIGPPEGVLAEVERRACSWETFGGNPGCSGKRIPHARLLRVDDGLPSVLDVRRAASLGNAVVPQAVTSIGRILMQRESSPRR